MALENGRTVGCVALALALVCRPAAAQPDLLSDLLATDEFAMSAGLELPKPKPSLPSRAALAAQERIPVIELLPSDPEEAELTRQYNRLTQDLRAGMKFAEQAFLPDATFLPTDRDPLDVALRRAAALFVHLARLPGAPDLAEPGRKLQELREAAARAPVEATDVRRQLFFQTGRLRRAVALANPLLNFTPGQFGARASKLYEHLSKGHKDVRLSDEEMHRITLWLDSVSLFYGVYEPEEQLVQLRGEVARPTLE